MSKEYNVKLQKKLEDYLEAEGLSQAKAAPILGISAAVLSHNPAILQPGPPKRL